MRVHVHTVARSLAMCVLSLSAFPATAQSLYPESPGLTADQGVILTLPPSNSVSHISVKGSEIWIGTGNGLARSSNAGRSWESFRSVPQFATENIFAVALQGDTIWASTGYTKDVQGKGVQTGTGYTYSLDNGFSWTTLPQTLDAQDDSIVTYGINTVKFLPIIVPEQNVTFDVALADSTVWIASWSSGLRRSTNLGNTWQRVVLPSFSRNSISPTDTLGRYDIDPRRDNNYLVFSVFVENDSTIWAGSAGGVNRSTDGGSSWVKFTTENQISHILGNWVIAIAAQRLGTATRIWTTNWKADRPNEQYGVSYTEDGGRIWTNLLQGTKAYAFAFKDSIVYIASDDGVYRTDDGGKSWVRPTTIIDTSTGQRLASTQFFSVGVVGDTVFCGGADGLAVTIDNAQHPFGKSWQVLRTYRPVGSTSSTYAYPNPFSPEQEVTRIHYSTGNAPAAVTIELFDFGMNRVRTIIKDAPRSGATEHDELWDGRDDGRRRIPNGVYLYRVVLNGGEPAWGKIMVLQ